MTNLKNKFLTESGTAEYCERLDTLFKSKQITCEMYGRMRHPAYVQENYKFKSFKFNKDIPLVVKTKDEFLNFMVRALFGIASSFERVDDLMEGLSEEDADSVWKNSTIFKPSFAETREMNMRMYYENIDPNYELNSFGTTLLFAAGIVSSIYTVDDLDNMSDDLYLFTVLGFVFRLVRHSLPTQFEAFWEFYCEDITNFYYNVE